MHGHGAARSERVCTDVLQGESWPCSPHSLALYPDDDNDAGGADGAETLRGGVVADGGGWITALFLESEEGIDAGSDKVGFWRLGKKV